MITFQVPLPPRELSSNGSHGHWMRRSTVAKAYRRDVGLEALQPFRSRWLGDGKIVPGCVRLSLTFCIKGGRAEKRYQPRDAANALSAFKAGIDGLVDAGMCPDDSQKHLELGAILIDSKRGPFVEVTVEAL